MAVGSKLTIKKHPGVVVTGLFLLEFRLSALSSAVNKRQNKSSCFIFQYGRTPSSWTEIVD